MADEPLNWDHPEFALTIPRSASAWGSSYIAAVEGLVQLYQEYGTQLEVERRIRNDTIDAEFANNDKARWTDVERVASWAAREAGYQTLLLIQRIKALEAHRDALAFLIDHADTVTS